MEFHSVFDDPEMLNKMKNEAELSITRAESEGRSVLDVIRQEKEELLAKMRQDMYDIDKRVRKTLLCKKYGYEEENRKVDYLMKKSSEIKDRNFDLIDIAISYVNVA